jgi:hypothetical protein
MAVDQSTPNSYGSIPRFGTLNGHFNVLQSEHLTEYCAIGSELMTDPKITSFVTCLREIVDPNSKDGVTPFVFLEGSSGIGETQTAFSIMSAFHVYYWVHRKVGLCNSVTLISNLFCLCVEKDM